MRKINITGDDRRYMWKQLCMHEEALEDVKKRFAKSTTWKDRYVYNGAIEYHQFKINNYLYMLNK